ncbi:hypothetical protein CLV84_2411 [Neolewinella xylanilytica]|uniref:Uncharacterized protein n=1 Tax=Neolewinella xylanilytica TaxID=1514080 RepID=A0A2S6I2U9_9BACT|nr:hypothetical protein [Neolewinella xylanilytica]PPK85512.1 hypothetical protein CLV84_2411 [Neolewinella xylanilytica]
MHFNRKPSHYRFFDAKTHGPVLADGGGKDKKPSSTPKKDVSKDDDDDDDLKHVDQSKGGYGHGSGFDKEN